MERDPRLWSSYSYTVELLELRTSVIELIEERIVELIEERGIEEDRCVKIRIRLDDPLSD